MSYEPKDFSHLLGLPGLSDTLLQNHFTLYQGYVKNTNTFLEKFKTLEVGTPEYAELHRRFGWEWNGMRLHELYFGNLAKEATSLAEDGELKKVFEYLWGGLEGWQKEFEGLMAMRGIGWVVLTYDKEKKLIMNTWVNEHDVGLLAGAEPLLVMDVFEHAYMLDYGIKRADYIRVCMNAIDWKTVEERLAKALK
jgi:Fe-Mn family superoxide dismutase